MESQVQRDIGERAEGAGRGEPAAQADVCEPEPGTHGGESITELEDWLVSQKQKQKPQHLTKGGVVTLNLRFNFRGG